MKSIGFDIKGDEHLIDDNAKESKHEANPLCGCNPDPYCDDPGYIGKRGPVRWWWWHYGLD